MVQVGGLNYCSCLVDGGTCIYSPADPKSPRSPVTWPHLGEPKVGELDVALAVQQDVLRLHVPINNAAAWDAHVDDADLSEVGGGGTRARFRDAGGAVRRALLHAPVVKVLQGEHQLRGEEAHQLHGEGLEPLQVEEELPALRSMIIWYHRISNCGPLTQ